MLTMGEIPAANFMQKHYFWVHKNQGVFFYHQVMNVLGAFLGMLNNKEMYISQHSCFVTIIEFLDT